MVIPVPVAAIPGLMYWPEFLSADEESALAGYAGAQLHWMPFGTRKRRLSFAYVYNVAGRTIVKSATPIPPLLHQLAVRLVEAKMMSVVAAQIVIQDYPAGVGIGRHVDAPVFGSEVCSVSLLSRCVMRFRHASEARPYVDQVLDPRSALAMTAGARTDWSHEIRGSSVLGRRLSITFRTVVRER